MDPETKEVSYENETVIQGFFHLKNGVQIWGRQKMKPSDPCKWHYSIQTRRNFYVVHWIYARKHGLLLNSLSDTFFSHALRSYITAEGWVGRQVNETIHNTKQCAQLQLNFMISSPDNKLNETFYLWPQYKHLISPIRIMNAGDHCQNKW